MPFSEPAASKRLIAVIVAIDAYDDPEIDDLLCAVNDAESIVDALVTTQPPDRLLLRVLAFPPRIEGALPPTRANVISAVQWAAEEAREGDTVLISFAGHGGLLDNKLIFLTKDFHPGAPTDKVWRESQVFLDTLQAPFLRHPSTRHVMFIDCCQNLSEQDRAALEEISAHSPQPEGHGETSQANAPLDTTRLHSDGWSIVFSCSPGERSLEDPKWGHHGIFSHFLAAGLRGEADQDHDGVVSFGELVQYLANRVPHQAAAVLSELEESDAPDCKENVSQSTQMPRVVWGGPVFLPITNTVIEGRAPFGREVLRLWPRFLHENIPYELPVQGMVRYGIAVLYGAVMAITFGLALPFADPVQVLAIAAAGGLLSAIIWHAAYGLIAASALTRWHSGGYFAGGMLLAWHCIAFLLLLCLWRFAGDTTTTKEVLVSTGLTLFATISMLVLFAFNPIQIIVVMADLAERNQRVTLRRAFNQLEERWLNADLPNVIAIASVHPRLVQYLSLACCLGPVAHAVYILASQSMAADSALLVLRDVLMILLIQWAVPWFGSAFHRIRSQLLPDR